MKSKPGNAVLEGFLEYVGAHLGKALGAIVIGAISLASFNLNSILDFLRLNDNPPPRTTSGPTRPTVPAARTENPIHLRVTATQQSAQNMAVAITESLTAELQRQAKASPARIELNIDNVRSGAGATKLATISWSIDLKGATPAKCHANGISFLKAAELSQKISTRIIRSLDEIETGRGTTCS